MNQIGNDSSFYLGCDVSLRGSGFAIIGLKNRSPFYVKSTTIRTDNKMTNGEALYKIASELQEFIKGYTFESVIREKGFTRFNISTQQIFMSLGLVHYILHEHDLFEVSPTTIKKVIGGHGACEKREVLNEACRLLNIPVETFEIPPTGRRKKTIYLEDESDACGAVLTHLIQKKII
ncbi:MAG: crossover junction endodeoxyribonuclease RuvC [Bacillota bacterium]